LGIQAEAGHLDVEVQRRDQISLRLRVGLNSGRVVAGEMGSGVMGYAAIGHTVGYAQRMESIAPHGGVVLSEATALLVEHAAVLKDTEMVRVKGADRPVPVRALVAK
jgi:adenylate cyclase